MLPAATVATPGRAARRLPTAAHRRRLANVNRVSAAVVSRIDEVGHALLEAADRLLTEEGAGALTVRRMATEAGVSTMNVYSRFGGKDGVVEQLWLKGFGLLAAAMETVGESSDPMADLRGCGVAYRRFAIDHATLYAVMFQRVVPDFEPSPSAQEAALATLQHLAARLERAMHAGAVRRMDPLQAAAVLWSTCHGVVSLELKDFQPPLIDWEQAFTDATAAIARGLAP